MHGRIRVNLLTRTLTRMSNLQEQTLTCGVFLLLSSFILQFKEKGLPDIYQISLAIFALAAMFAATSDFSGASERLVADILRSKHDPETKHAFRKMLRFKCGTFRQTHMGVTHFLLAAGFVICWCLAGWSLLLATWAPLLLKVVVLLSAAALGLIALLASIHLGQRFSNASNACVNFERNIRRSRRDNDAEHGSGDGSLHWRGTELQVRMLTVVRHIQRTLVNIRRFFSRVRKSINYYPA